MVWPVVPVRLDRSDVFPFMFRYPPFDYGHRPDDYDSGGRKSRIYYFCGLDFPDAGALGLYQVFLLGVFNGI